MNLKSKIGLLLTATAILLGLAYFYVQKITIYPAIAELEKSFARKDMERCVEALNRELLHIERTVDEWASRDEASGFIQCMTLDYIEANLHKETFTANNIHLIYFLDNDGWMAWGKIYAPNFNEEISLLNFPHQFRIANPLLKNTLNHTSSGAIITEQGPMLIAARPIINHDSNSSSNGTLIMGQFISQPFIDSLISQTRVPLKVTPFQQEDKTVQPIIKQINGGVTYPVTITNNTALLGYAAFHGLNNEPTLLIQGEIQRDIAAKGLAGLHATIFITGIVSVLLFLCLLLLLEQIVITPLHNMARHTIEIRQQKDLLSRLPPLNRNDEIGSLTQEMNHLLDFQQELHETLENRVENRTLELSASNHLLTAEIAEHQKTQAEFKKLNEELEAIFTTSRVGIMSLRGGRFLHKCNKRLAEIFGYDSPEEMKKISMEKLHLSRDHFLEFGQKYYQTLQQGVQTQVEYEFRKKDGGKIWCLLSGMAMDTATPPDLDKGVTWVVDDITRRKEEEHKLAELAKMQGMFATIGGVCHELGQPVQIISAHTQILKKQKNPNPLHLMNRIQSIYEQTERMGDILKNLQSITRYETTDYVAGLQILDINKSSEHNRNEA